MYNAIIKKSIASGKITPPPSKSVSHRYLIFAALSKNNITINNIDYSDDINATIESLTAFGCIIKKNEKSVVIDSTKFLEEYNDKHLNANESGSTLRFMIPLCLLDNKERIIKCSKKLLERPLDEYTKLSNDNNFILEKYDDYIKIKGILDNNEYNISSTLSSQFITGLIFSSCYMKKDTRINLIGDINSKSYIDMTIDAANEFGFDVEWASDNTINIHNSFKLKKNDFIVESDYSNSAFLDAFNYINGKVEVLNLSLNSRQGDKVYKEYFEKIKNGIPTLDMNDCPDLAPIIIALSIVNNGAKLIGTRRLKIKESDRATAMKEEVNKLGADIEIFDDEIIINKYDIKEAKSIINSHNDHRIVMAMSILLSMVGGEIKQADAVNKSYPNFFNDLKKLGVEVEIK